MSKFEKVDTTITISFEIYGMKEKRIECLYPLDNHIYKILPQYFSRQGSKIIEEQESVVASLMDEFKMKRYAKFE